MGLHVKITEKPDGYHWSWWDQPENIPKEGVQAIMWSHNEPAPTFALAVLEMHNSIRARHPYGQLQNEREPDGVVIEQSNAKANVEQPPSKPRAKGGVHVRAREKRGV